MKLLIVILSFSLFAISCNTKKVACLKKDNVSINYPQDWLVKDMDYYLILVSEPAKEEISVLTTFDVQRHENQNNLDDYLDNYFQEMYKNKVFKNFEIKSRQDIEFKKHNAIKYNCTATVEALPIEWESIIFTINNQIYQLTTTSLSYNFLPMKEKTDAIFRSFKLDH